MEEIEVPDLLDIVLPSGEVMLQADPSTLLGAYSAEELEAFQDAFVYAKAEEAILREHTKSLAKFTGSQSPEERDTWPEQRRWAEVYNSQDTSNPDWLEIKALLEDMVTDEESQAIGGGDKAGFMADKIMANVGFFQVLISEASRAKRDAFAALNNIRSDRAAMRSFIDTLKATRAAREQAFVHKVYG